MRRAYILKRTDIDDKTVYVFRRKSVMREFIKKTMSTVGGVWMQLIVHFNSEDEEREFYKKCSEHVNIVVFH